VDQGEQAPQSCLARDQTDLERFPYDTLTPVAKADLDGRRAEEVRRSRPRPKSRSPLKDKNKAAAPGLTG
jgi:hypothetical protein